MKMKLLTLLMMAISFTTYAERSVQLQRMEDNYPNPSVYVSDWTEVKNWKTAAVQGKQGFYAEQMIPAKNELANSVVLTFAKMKGYNSSYKMFNKPITLPFYFLSEENKGADVYYWFDTNTPGTLKIGYQTDASALTSHQNMEFRYFILPYAFLENHKLDEAAVKHFTYKQLVQLLNVAE